MEIQGIWIASSLVAVYSRHYDIPIDFFANKSTIECLIEKDTISHTHTFYIRGHKE